MQFKYHTSLYVSHTSVELKKRNTYNLLEIPLTRTKTCKMTTKRKDSKILIEAIFG